MLTKPVMASFNIPPRQNIVTRLEAPWHKANLAQPKEAASNIAHLLARRTHIVTQTHMNKQTKYDTLKKNTRKKTLHICV